MNITQTFVGNIVRDPELYVSSTNGRSIASFDLAVNNRRRDAEGEFHDEPAVFHRVVCFGPQADNIAESLRRGVEVIVIGHFIDDSYTTDDGSRRTRITIRASHVAPTLRYAIARPVKVARDDTGPEGPGPLHSVQ